MRLEGYSVEETSRGPLLYRGEEMMFSASLAEVWLDQRLSELEQLVELVRWVRLNPDDPKTWPEDCEAVLIWRNGDLMGLPATFMDPAKHPKSEKALRPDAALLPHFLMDGGGTLMNQAEMGGGARATVVEMDVLPLESVIYWRLKAEGVDTPSVMFTGDGP